MHYVATAATIAWNYGKWPALGGAIGGALGGGVAIYDQNRAQLHPGDAIFTGAVLGAVIPVGIKLIPYAITILNYGAYYAYQVAQVPTTYLVLTGVGCGIAAVSRRDDARMKGFALAILSLGALTYLNGA
jgi:hypothetical protein